MITDILKQWDKYGYHIMLFGGLLMIFVLWFLRDKKDASYGDLTEYPLYSSPNNGLNGVNGVNGEKAKKTKKSKQGGDSKGEILCRQYLERVFSGLSFDKIRPSFLKNPKTGRNLELDMYNEKINLALEYNGSQHYYFSPWYHRTQSGFDDQKFRDKHKTEVCNKRGINLIVVPYTIDTKEDIENYIYLELKKLGLY
jgi:hypothetical protein